MTQPAEMFDAVREHFPQAEFIQELRPGGPCFVCQRAGLPGLAYKSNHVCNQCAPHAGAGELMLSFSETETEAIEAGGAVAGEFLDGINKTDLAELTPEQWHEFLGKFLEGYSGFMRDEVKRCPPF